MNNWIWWMIAGVLSLIGGFFALANPLAATLTAELFAGWTFMLVGVLILVSAFNDQGWGARIAAIVLGVFVLIFGINLVANPLAGMITLTVMAGVMLLVVGICRIMLAFATDVSQVRWVMILSGALSILLGIMIFSNFPQSAAVVLGVFLAVELISNGVSLIVLSLARKPEEQAQ